VHLIELHLNCGSRQRAIAPPSVERAADDAQRDIVGMLIDQAQAQLAASLRNAESHDTKALGLLAVEVASVLALLNLHAALNRFWPSLLAGACLSMAAFCVTLWSRAFRLGPAIDPLYEEFIDRPALDASIAILDVLNQSIVDNQTIVEVKKRAWVIGAVIMFVTVVAGAIFLPVVR
jgi:hypothetical protein